MEPVTRGSKPELPGSLFKRIITVESADYVQRIGHSPNMYFHTPERSTSPFHLWTLLHLLARLEAGHWFRNPFPHLTKLRF